MYLVGIFDRKAQTFISLEPTPAIGIATRQLNEVVNTKTDNPIYKWPEDYSLWELGTWNSESGFALAIENDSGQYERKLIVECESLKTRN